MALTDPILVTMYGACEPGGATVAADVMAAQAKEQLGEIVPLAAGEFDGRVARQRMTEANQPDASIAAIEAYLASVRDGRLVEFAFLAERSVVVGRPDTYAGGRAGRRH